MPLAKGEDEGTRKIIEEMKLTVLPDNIDVGGICPNCSGGIDRKNIGSTPWIECRSCGLGRAG